MEAKGNKKIGADWKGEPVKVDVEVKNENVPTVEKQQEGGKTNG